MIIIKPIGSGTRLRDQHNTAGTVLASYGPSNTCSGTEDWIAPDDAYNTATPPALINQNGDRWLLVTNVDGINLVTPGWMAITHKGQPICTVLQENEPTPNPDPDGVKRIISSVVTYETNSGEIKTIRLVPE